MNAERRAALSGLMVGMTSFIPHRDLAVALGFTVTDTYNELREMEIDGLVEREKLKDHKNPLKRYQYHVGWRLKRAA